MQLPAFKCCPKCQQPAVLDKVICGRCGYRYARRGAPWKTIALLAAIFLIGCLLPLAGQKQTGTPAQPASETTAEEESVLALSHRITPRWPPASVLRELGEPDKVQQETDVTDQRTEYWYYYRNDGTLQIRFEYGMVWSINVY